MSMGRRGLLAASAALPLVAIRTRPLSAAEFTLTLAVGQPASSAVAGRLQDRLGRVEAATQGRVSVKAVPKAELGSDESQWARLRAGEIGLVTMSTARLSAMAPPVGLTNVGFAFASEEQAYKGLDGALGAYLTSQLAATGVRLIAPVGSNGFRQVTSGERQIRVPEDMNGFTIRLPPLPLFTTLFEALGAKETPIEFKELFNGLKNRALGGQENALPIIEFLKLYDAQPFCSLTDHIWDGYCLLANPGALARLPPDVGATVEREFAQAMREQRTDQAQEDDRAKASLQSKGMTFIEVDKAAFRAALRQAGYYAKWKAAFGEQSWSALQSATGPLV